MNLDEIQHQLYEIANSGDETFANFASQISTIVEQAKAGQLSNEEVAEIMTDAQSQLAILDEMSAMQFKEKLNTIINGLIMIAKAV